MLNRSRRADKRAEYEAELWMPEFPMSMMYLWRVYHRLRGRKGGNGFGHSPLEWPDIEAFSRLSGLSLLSWEVALIERMDDLWLRAQAQAQKDSEQ